MQIRDMTGTGEVTKRRIREGVGEFPIDCPLEDNAVKVHFKAFRLDTEKVPAAPLGLFNQALTIWGMRTP